MKKVIIVIFLLFPLKAFCSDSIYIPHYDDYLELVSEVANRREKSFLIVNNSCYSYSLFHYLNDFFDSFSCYDPYSYWHLDDYSVALNKCNALRVNFSWLTTAEQERSLLKDVQQILDNYLSDDMSDFEKTRIIHDLIVANVEYSSWVEPTAYYLFQERKGLCTSYSLLTLRALELAGIKAIIIKGYANGYLHVWNMVELCCGDDCKWFHLDVTWDDPLPDVPGRVGYKYFLLSDEEIKKDHDIINNCSLEAPIDFVTWQTSCLNKGEEIYSPGILIDLSLNYEQNNFIKIGEDIVFKAKVKIFELKEIYDEIEYYLKAVTPFGIYWYDGENWQQSQVPFYTGFPVDLDKTYVFSSEGLIEGPYILYLLIDNKGDSSPENIVVKRRISLYLVN